MSSINYVTKETLEALRADLQHMKGVDRPAASRAIAEAREKGDLRENAEYDAAKEAQGHLEAKIAALEGQIANARIIETSDVDTSKVSILTNINFKAVELDDEKVMYLKNTYPVLADKIIHQSFLDIEKPFEDPFTVVGNFPYNISTQILFKILEWEGAVPCVVGMFQKEVAQRVAAKEGNKVYGVTSVLVQAFYEVEYLFDVDEKSFNPPPKVKSGVIRLTPRKEALDIKSRKHFFNLVKTAFNQRRKTLRNACRGLFTPEVLEEEIFNKRAEQLSIQDFALLSFRLR